MLEAGKWLCGVVVLMTAISFSTIVQAQMLRPARAVYDLQLNQDRESKGVDAATARLVVELIEDCSGFIFNQAFISNISTGEGPDLIGEMQASVWESRDGRALRFNLLNKINGKVVEQEQGRAKLGGRAGGNATWRLPKARELALPRGTLFPVSHNREVLAQAMAGSRGFEIPLFDGSNEAGYYHASVFIGAPFSGKDSGKLSPADQPSWPVRLAYFHYDNNLGTPEFEVGFPLYGNGVVDRLSLDYPEFGLTGHLVDLKYLDQPDCE